MNNMFSSLPENIDEEVSEDIVKGKHVRIERIVSHRHSSPSTGWYDQIEIRLTHLAFIFIATLWQRPDAKAREEGEG
jgi:hypothetical protein